MQGSPCSDPDTVVAHASCAFDAFFDFDAYYYKIGMADRTCDFDGVASVTTADPSHASCIFPGSGGGGIVPLQMPPLLLHHWTPQSLAAIRSICLRTVSFLAP
ncbi:hypothetical protein ACH5RR_029917 [Cinchona calisaya]|uniref:X8 domain-containing protein n=1 Tax=Cinchona calisaya TaxID=153742 RepID=A0ABD2YT28_9GENT